MFKIKAGKGEFCDIKPCEASETLKNTPFSSPKDYNTYFIVDKRSIMNMRGKGAEIACNAKFRYFIGV